MGKSGILFFPAKRLVEPAVNNRFPLFYQQLAVFGRFKNNYSSGIENNDKFLNGSYV